MYSLSLQQKHLWRYACHISGKFYSNRPSPVVVQQIQQKNDDQRNQEPVAIVVPKSNLSNETSLDFNKITNKKPPPSSFVLTRRGGELTNSMPSAGSFIEQISPLNIETLVPTTTTTPTIIDKQQTINDDSKKIKKKQNENVWTITPATFTDFKTLGNHYLMLSKFRLTSLVVITSMAGYAMAPAPFELSTFLLCTVGTGLCSAAANSINQYHEVPFDAQMSRTKNRVLVKGMVTPLHAIGFAVGAAGTGVCMLYYGVNGLTALLGAGNLFLYTSIYTPMKRYSILNTWIGSIVGAIPPVMGWVGCSGTFDAGAWILAGLLYAWQFPHFNALSWNLRPDYSRAGYRMMAVTNPALCRRTALRYTGVITALSLAAPYFDVTNLWFALETLPLNAYFGYLAWKFYKHSDSGSSRKLFRFSLIHLPALMILFLLNKKHWIFMEESTEIASVAAIISPEAAVAATATTLAAAEAPAISTTNTANSIESSSGNLNTSTATVVNDINNNALQNELEKKAISSLRELMR